MEPSQVKTDVVTGEPFIPEDAPGKHDAGREIEKERTRLERAITQRNDLIADLQGAGGPIIREVIKLFVKRLDALSQADPECMGYLKMLAAIQHPINIAERAITKMAEDLLNYAAPAGDTGKK